MENWTKKWIRPNIVLNMSHFGLELGYLHLRREKRRGEEEKERREEEKKKKEERKKRRRSF